MRHGTARSRRARHGAIFFLLAAALLAGESQAATQNFTGARSGDIEDPANYAPGSEVPADETASDVLQIAESPAHQPRLSRSRCLAGLVFAGTALGASLGRGRRRGFLDLSLTR